MVPALVPSRQTPESSVGTGPQLGHGSVAADGLGAVDPVAVAAVAVSADVAGGLAPPHPLTIRTARTKAPFLIPLLLPPALRRRSWGNCWPIAGRFHRGNYVQPSRYGRRSVAPRAPAIHAANWER